MVKLPNDGPVVMVDDNQGDLFFIEQCYVTAQLANPWRAFSRGADFLALLERVKRKEEPMPALVMLDLNMPALNGLEILQIVRADPYFVNLPVFCVLTSSTDPRDRERAQRLGVSGFYNKADNMEDYIAFFQSLSL